MPSCAFITGGSGLFGLNFILQKQFIYKFLALQNNKKIDLKNVKPIQMNLNNLKSIESVLKVHLPKIVIHAAGMTNVDECEQNPQRANFINGNFSGNLAKVSYELGIKFVYISTDHIFDGTRSNITEDTPPSPVNAYGFSKALGEKLVIKDNPDALIIRCNFFGWGPSYKKSFSDFIYDSLSDQLNIKLVNDIFYTPLSTFNLNNAIHTLLMKDASGIFNLVGHERISKHDFGLKLAAAFGLPKDLIEEASRVSLDLKATRPVDMSLSDCKVSKYIGHNLGSIDENIRALKIQTDTQLYERIKSL